MRELSSINQDAVNLADITWAQLSVDHSERALYIKGRDMRSEPGVKVAKAAINREAGGPASGYRQVEQN